MIYEFDDPISFLKSTFEEKSRLNANYSMRAFAKKLGLSSGGLSLILNRKKRLSQERAHEIARILGLNEEQSEYFLLLLQLEAAKSNDLRIKYLERLKTLNPYMNEGKKFKQTILELEHFKFISKWYGLALFELISSVKGKWTTKLLSEKLGLSIIETQVMLERLKNLELIDETEDKTWDRCADSVMISSGIPNEALRNYYEQLHEKSLASVREQSPNEKIIGSQVFAFDLSQMQKVKELSHRYLNELEQLSLEGTNKTEIYQALVNVFRLSKRSQNEIN